MVAGDLVNAYTTYPKMEVGSPVNVFVVVKNAGNVAEQPEFALKVTKAHSQERSVPWQGTTGSGLLPGQTCGLRGDVAGCIDRDADARRLLSHCRRQLSGGSRSARRTSPSSWSRTGRFTEAGSCSSLELSNHPQAGYSAEVQAQVESTGEVQQETSFVGQLYRNGRLVEGIKSPVPILLQPGQNGIITMPVPVAKNGEYQLSGTRQFRRRRRATRRP